jgi:hypothetical protein
LLFKAWEKQFQKVQVLLYKGVDVRNPSLNNDDNISLSLVGLAALVQTPKSYYKKKKEIDYLFIYTNLIVTKAPNL